MSFVCGGEDFTNNNTVLPHCFKLQFRNEEVADNEWIIQKDVLKTPRTNAQATITVRMGENVLLITGGQDNSGDVLDTSEIINMDGTSHEGSNFMAFKS